LSGFTKREGLRKRRQEQQEIATNVGLQTDELKQASFTYANERQEG
jgi:hypothetical protein